MSNSINNSLSISDGCAVLMPLEQWAALTTFIKDESFQRVFAQFGAHPVNTMRIENIELQVIYTNSAYAYVAEKPPITISENLSLTVNMIMTIVINTSIIKLELTEKRSAQHDRDVVLALVAWDKEVAKKIIVEMSYRLLKANIKKLSVELHKNDIQYPTIYP